jgi:hypothetical protein
MMNKRQTKNKKQNIYVYNNNLENITIQSLLK